MATRKSFSCVPLPGPQSSIDIEVHDDGSIEVDVGAEYGGSLSAAKARELADAIRELQPGNVVFFPITPTCSNDGCERSPVVTVVIGVAGVQLCLQCLPDNTPDAVLTLLHALETP